MKRRNIIGTALIAGLFFLCATASYAMPIWGTAVSGSDLSGSRTSDENGGVYATGQWADGGFEISWDIEQDPTTEYWTYTYTLTADEEISHLILEVTEDEFGFNILDGSSPVEDSDGKPAQLWDTPEGIPLSDLYGIKFDIGGEPVTYTLITDRAPVWGVFFAKRNDDTAPEEIYAWSSALSDSNYKENKELTNFIARPDGGNSLPEPPTMLLVGASLIGLAGLGRKNIFKKKKTKKK